MNDVIAIVGTEGLIQFLLYGASGAMYLFGAWMPLLGILLTFIAIDIITGIAKGFYDKELRSRKMSQGMISKAMYFFVIIIANMLDVMLTGGLPICKTAVCFFYIGLEGLSIVENLALMNVPLPKFIKRYLLVLKEKGDGGDADKQIVVPLNDNEVTLEFREVETKGE